MHNIIKVNKAHLRRKFWSGSILASSEPGLSVAIDFVKKPYKIRDFAHVSKFFGDVENIDLIDVYHMDGELYKAVSDSMGNSQDSFAFAVFFDGNEQDTTTKILHNDKMDILDVRPEAPIMMVSDSVFKDRLLLETTLVHEFFHFVDKSSENESSEPKAIRAEYNFLTGVYSLDEKDADEFLKNKYQKNFGE
jgi:hypothetical protein